MGECTCHRTGRHARLHQLPCGDHMIVVRDPDGGWSVIHDDAAHADARFALWPLDDNRVELEDRRSGERQSFPRLTDALVAVCGLCGDASGAPCRVATVAAAPAG